MTKPDDPNVLPLKPLGVLSLRPGDALVLTVEEDLGEDAWVTLCERFGAAMEQLGLSYHVPVIVLEKATLGVLRKGET